MLVIPDPEQTLLAIQGLRPAETQVLFALGLLGCGNMPMIVTLDEIMVATGLSKPTVNRCTHSLTRAELLNVWDRGRGPGATMKIRINPFLMLAIKEDVAGTRRLKRELGKLQKQFWLERAKPHPKEERS